MFRLPKAVDVALNQVERTGKFDVRYVLKGGFFLSFAHIISTISGLLLTLGLVRFLSQDGYGLYSYVFAMVGTLGAFTLSGIDIAVTQSTAKGHDATIHKGFRLKLLWSIPVFVFSVAGGIYYLIHGNIILGFALLGFALSIPFTIPTTLYGSFLNGKKEFRKLAGDNILRNISSTATMLVVAYYTHDILYTFIAYLVVSSLISAYRYLKLAKTIPEDTTVEESSISLGKHLSLIGMISTVITHIDKIIIFQLLGVSQLALYAIALAPAKQMQGVAKMVSGMVIPKFGVRNYEEIKLTIWHKVLFAFLGYVTLAMLYIIAAPHIFHYLFPGYEESIKYSQVLVLSGIFLPFLLFSHALMALHRKRALYVSALVKPFFKIVPLIILVPLYGVWGAVLSYVIFYCLHTTLFIVMFYQKRI